LELARYETDSRFIESKMGAIAAGEEITMNLRDNESMEWRLVKGILYKEAVKGTEEIIVIDQITNAVKGSYFLKVVEAGSEDDELDGFEMSGEAP
jgi:hypothetical protein